MARPIKQGLDYFPHDTDASSDPKLEPLIILYGARGYAFYFMHLEYIYKCEDLTLDISDAETRQIFCRKLAVTEQEYDQILKSALKHGCFNKDIYTEKGCLTSNGVQKRASVVVEKREKMRALYDAKRISAAETREETTQETYPETPQSKVKKSKVKKEIYKERYGQFNNVLLSAEEIEKIKEKFPFDFKERIERLSEYIEQIGQRRAAKYASHYATILSWSRKDNKPAFDPGSDNNPSRVKFND